jgi:hypothetical protein
MKTEIKTAEEFFREKIRENYLLPREFSLSQMDFLNSEKAVRWAKEYANQFKPKWNTFTSDRSTDPKDRELVIIVCRQFKPEKPKLISWYAGCQVMDGDEWIYVNDIIL